MKKIFVISFLLLSLCAYSQVITPASSTTQTIDVKNFGMRAGGTAANNKAALDRATAYAAIVHKDVLISDNFKVSPFTLPQYVNIVGSGWQTGLELPASGHFTNLITLSGGSNTISNMTLNGGRTNLTGDSITGIINGTSFTKLKISNVNFRNAAYHAVALLTCSYVSIYNCQFDSSGRSDIDIKDAAHTALYGNVHNGFAFLINGTSAINFGSNTAHTFYDLSIRDCKFFNPYNSGKFFIETPGAAAQSDNIVLEGNYYDAMYHSTGSVSCSIDTLRSAFNQYVHQKNTGTNIALAVESSGSDLHFINEQFGNGGVRLSANLTSIAKSISLSHCTWTIDTTTAGFDCVLGIGGNNKIIDGLIVDHCTIHAEKANTTVLFNFGNSEGSAAKMLNCSVTDNNFYTGNGAVGIYFTGNVDSKNNRFVSNNYINSFSSGNMFQYGSGKYWQTKFINNIAPQPSTLFSGMDNSLFPNQLRVANINDTSAIYSDYSDQLTGVKAITDFIGINSTQTLFTYSVPNDGLVKAYEIFATVNPTAIAGGGVLTTTVAYTDDNNTAATVTMQTAGASPVSGVTTTGAKILQVLGQINAYPGTNITATTTLTVGTSTFNVSATLIKIRNGAAL